MFGYKGIFDSTQKNIQLKIKLDVRLNIYAKFFLSFSPIKFVYMLYRFEIKKKVIHQSFRVKSVLR